MTALILKIVLPLSLLALGALLVVLDHQRPPRHLNERQAVAIESLKTAAPSQKDLK